MAPVAQTGTGNVTSASAISANSLVVNRPSNTADGDLLVAAVWHRNAGRTFTPPSGWSQLGSPDAGSATYGFWAKPITSASGEPSTYTFGADQSARFIVAIIRVTGADLTTPLDAQGSVALYTGTTSVIDPAVVAVSSGALLLAFNMNNRSSTPQSVFTAPAGMAEVVQVAVANAVTPTGYSVIQVAQESLAASGSTGTRTATMSPAAANSGGFLLTVKAAPVTTVTGDVAATLPPMTGAASGTVTDGTVSGAAGATLPSLTATFGGTSDATRPSVSRAAALGTGATSGATVTTANSGRAAGVPFDTFTIGAGASLTWDTTHGGYYGDRALRITTGGTGVNAYARWDTVYRPAAGAAQVATAWLYVPALTSSTSVIYVANSSGQRICEMRLSSTGHLRAINGAGTQVLETTAGIALNQWVRADLLFTPDASNGSLQLKLYNDPSSSTPTEATAVATGQNLRQSQVDLVYVGNVISAANVDMWVQAHITDGDPPPPTGGFVLSRWLGAVTDTSAGLAARVLGASSVRLAVSTSPTLTSPAYSSSQVPDADGTARMTVTGLTAGTTYFYGVEVDGQIDQGARGSFRTAPAAGEQTSFVFTAASCAQNNSNALTFDAIRSENPRFFVHLGDLHYRDIATNDQAAIHRAYDQVMAAQRQAALFGTIPVPYIWSDHDSTGPNGDRTSAALPASNAVYRSRVPAYPGMPSTTGTYFAFTWGRVRVVCTDGRTFMDPITDADGPSKTKLGSTQKAWLLGELADASHALIIWCHEDAISNGATFSGDDTWSAYPTERAQILAAIAAAGTNVAYVCGDLHVLAADSGANVPTTGANSGVPVHVCSPLDQSAYVGNGTYSAGHYPPADTMPPNFFQQYGRFEVTDTGDQITLLYQGKDSGGTVRVTQTTTWDVPIPPSGSLTAALPPLAAAAAGQATAGGALAAALPSLAAATAGTATASGELTAALPPLTAAGAGEVIARGDLAAGLPALTAAAAGQTTAVGDLGATLPPLAADLAGHADQGAGSLMSTLPALTIGAAGTVTVTGGGLVALPGLAATADGGLTASAAAAAVLPALTAAASGTATAAGTAGPTLPALGADLAGGLRVTGGPGATLPSLASAFTADAGDVTTATLQVALPPLSTSTAGQLITVGAAAATLPPIGADLAGQQPAAGALTAQLPALAAALQGTSASRIGGSATPRDRRGTQMSAFIRAGSPTGGS